MNSVDADGVVQSTGEVATDDIPTPARRVTRQVIGERLRRAGILPAFVLVIVVGTLLSSNFFTVANFRDVLSTSSVIGMLAIGEALVILAGGAGIDLSVGATMTLASIVGARFAGDGAVAVIAAALLTGAYVGTVNGLGVTVARLEPFIVTLGTLTMAEGAAYFISNASPLTLSGSAALPWLGKNVGGIPLSGIVFIVAIIIGQIVLSRSVFGREVYIVGGNEEAAHYAGVPVRRRRFVIYLMSGICAGAAALLVIAQLGTADPNFGATYNLQAIAAVVIGGVPLTGGRGSLIGTLGGVLVIGCVTDLLGLLNVSSYVQLVVTGVIVLVVVGLNRRGSQGSLKDFKAALPLLISRAIGGVIMFKLLGAS